MPNVRPSATQNACEPDVLTILRVDDEVKSLLLRMLVTGWRLPRSLS
jgi:hypothetical protein